MAMAQAPPHPIWSACRPQEALRDSAPPAAPPPLAWTVVPLCLSAPGRPSASERRGYWSFLISSLKSSGSTSSGSSDEPEWCSGEAGASRMVLVSPEASPEVSALASTVGAALVVGDGAAGFDFTSTAAAALGRPATRVRTISTAVNTPKDSPNAFSPAADGLALSLPDAPTESQAHVRDRCGGVTTPLVSVRGLAWLGSAYAFQPAPMRVSLSSMAGALEAMRHSSFL